MAGEAGTAPNWPLVARLRPALRRHVRLYPQCYRGQRWYVLHDESTGENLRFNAAAYRFIARLDGRRNVAHIVTQLNTEAPGSLSEDEATRLLAQLFAIDALRSSLPGDAREYFRRYQHNRALRRRRSLLNPLAIRIPLLDPDRLLERLLPWLRPLMSRAMWLLWALVVGVALALAAAHADELGAAWNPRVLAPQNLASMFVAFVVLKTLHEFAHALMVKRWGGEVHEMGITLLVLAPVPYVDASAAWTFPDRHKRILVGLAGMLAELFVAALALYAWLLLPPGLARDACLNLMLIGSVSTLLFNANPLLRYDGYYILQDALEIPNLYTRASRYWSWLTLRYLFGLRDARSPVTAPGEAGWFLIYAPLAFCYRIFILLAIALLLAQKYLVLGVALAGWALLNQLVAPFLRGLRSLAADPRLGGRRARAILVSALILAASGGLLFSVPVPLTGHADGIVWVRDQARIHAGIAGFVEEVAHRSGDRVEPGDVLLRLRSPELEKQLAVRRARRDELRATVSRELDRDRAKAREAQESLALAEKELRELQQRAQATTIRAEVAGTLVLPPGPPLNGRWLAQGEAIGYVLAPRGFIVRAVLPQADAGLPLRAARRVTVRLVERPDEDLDAKLIAETPAADDHLPSVALGVAGGGDIAVRKDADGETAAEPLFRIDLALPGDARVAGIGERAWVRIEHRAEPLPRRWLRGARRLLMERLGI